MSKTLLARAARGLHFVVATAPIVAVAAQPAARPTAMRIFPPDTVAFLRTADASDFAHRYRESHSGRFWSDPEVAPFVEESVSYANENTAEGLNEATGAELTDLLALLRGEVAVGLVYRQNKWPAVLALVDTGDPSGAGEGQLTAETLIERLRGFAERKGATVAEEPIGADTALVIRDGENADNAAGLVRRGGVLVIASDAEVLAAALGRWDGGEDATESLADNAAFAAALAQCAPVGGEEPPLAIAFCDPVGVFRAVAQTNTGARIGLAMLPALGLNAVRGAAAATWIGAEQGAVEGLLRAHLLLDNPRSGVLKIVRLAPCDPTPAPSVPALVTEHQVLAVDPAATYDRVAALFDAIRGDGEFAKLVRSRVDDKIGLGLRGEFLPLLSGRVELVLSYGDDPPGVAPRALPARATLLRTTDPGAAYAAVRGALERLGLPIEEAEFRGAKYLRRAAGSDRPAAEPEEPAPDFPVVGLIGDDLAACQTESLFRKFVDTHEGDGDRLADSLVFRLMQSRIRRKATGPQGLDEGVWLSYSDPSEQFRRMLASWESEEGRAQLDQIADRAPPFRALRDILERGGAPPTEAVLKHLTPSASVVYDTPTGFRYEAASFPPAEE